MPDQADFPTLLAVQALAFIARDEQALFAFVQTTGFNPTDMRSIPEADLLAGVMDFMMQSDDLLQVFAKSQAIQPEIVVRAAKTILGEREESAA